MAKAKRAPALLPDIPLELATPKDRKRTRAREAARRQMAQGRQLVSAVLWREEIDYLMAEWGFKDRAQMLRVAVRFLAAQTRGGLTSIEVMD